MRHLMREAHPRFRVSQEMFETFEKNMKAGILQAEMQDMVTRYGLCEVLNAMCDEAARLVLCHYCTDAVKIHDVLRACKEELCDHNMT